MADVGYKKLAVWHKSDELAYQVYLATKNFPKQEMYGITSQLRRAALSIPTNIAEGYARQGKNELRQFVSISLGSLAETKYCWIFP
jgi:four helix bundle protein